jgi:hypothetical protein
MSLRELLSKHVGSEVGINLHSAHRVESAKLIAVADDHFSAATEQDSNLYHVPYPNIVKVIENPGGVVVSGFFKSHKLHPLVIKIGHVVEYVPT